MMGTDDSSELVEFFIWQRFVIHRQWNIKQKKTHKQTQVERVITAQRR